MMSCDVGECPVSVLLDLSATFDTVDHSILTERRRQWVGVSGSALYWFSYLLGRIFFVASYLCAGNCCLLCGVPQGSVLSVIACYLFCIC